MVRPRRMAPLPILAQFLQMAVAPAAGVAAVIKSRPGLGAIAVLLGVVGLLRGVVEGFWYYLMMGKVHQLPELLTRPEWYTRYGGPFLILNIPSAHFLWFTTAVILYAGARLLGARGSFRQVLQVTGVALISYLPIGLFNYLHVWLELPSLTLDASDFYRPNLGIGQLVVFVWLTFVAYHALRQIFDLAPGSAALSAPLPVLLSLLLYLFSAGAFFWLAPRLPGSRPSDWLAMANVAYLLATAGLTGLMAVGSRYLLKAGEGDERNA